MVNEEALWAIPFDMYLHFSKINCFLTWSFTQASWNHALHCWLPLKLIFRQSTLNDRNRMTSSLPFHSLWWSLSCLSSFLFHRTTTIAFSSFVVFGFIVSIFTFLLPALGWKLLAEVKGRGLCFSPCFLRSFSGLDMTLQETAFRN